MNEKVYIKEIVTGSQLSLRPGKRGRLYKKYEVRTLNDLGERIGLSIAKSKRQAENIKDATLKRMIRQELRKK